ncbi:Pyruvate dehydrogenase E1 component protein [Pyrenophora tritici-repentis]|nr:Pyruvate dehydrogenase E1 component protein [Pyrenophora tritici-repentis]
MLSRTIRRSIASPFRRNVIAPAARPAFRSVTTDAASSHTDPANVPAEDDKPFEIRLSDESFETYELDPPPYTMQVTKKELKKMYYDMVAVRRMEMAADRLYKEKKIRGFCHLSTGQEAVAVGIEHAIERADHLITAYRCHGFALMRGATVKSIIGELLGRREGIAYGKGGSMHMFAPGFYGGNGIVGAQVPVGAGIAFACQYENKKNVTLALYGDGASNQGQVFEAFNMAKLWNLPVIFGCENNKYGMGTAANRSSALTDYYKRGQYIPGLKINGMDVLAVKAAVKYGKEYCAADKGPLVYEYVTYRYGGHSMSDPGTTYRTREEIQRMRSTNDPIAGLKQKLLDWGVTSEEELKSIDKQARSEVDAEVAEAEKMAAPEPTGKVLYEDIYVRGSEPEFLRGRIPEENFYYTEHDMGDLSPYTSPHRRPHAAQKRVSDSAPRLESARGTASQPVAIDSQSYQSQPSALSPPPPYTHTFESRLRESQPEDAIVAPAEGSFDAHLEDNYDGIDWGRLKLYTKPITTHQHKRSWIYRHGYRVALLKDPTRVFFICHWCFKHKLTDIGIGIYNTSAAVSSAARHLSEQKPGHRLVAPGKTPVASVYNALTTARVPISQAVANQINGFSKQRFRFAAVDWLVANNHPISEFETPAFRRLIAIANPLAEAALWKNHKSVSQYVIRLLLWGRDADSYNNEGVDELADEAAFIKEWRKHGPLGVLLDIVNYIHTPQQYNLFEKAQRTAYRELPHDADDKLTILQPIKPVVTRWNSYFDCFERAIKLAPAINAGYLRRLTGQNRPAAPQWMRSDGLTAADWAVVTDYIEVLRPLKECTKRFEGRGEYSFGAIAEVIPTFEFLLTQLEARLLYYDCVVHDAHDEAPEDHLPINLRAALLKANEYYAKLDDSPAYYAATILHPRYKHYCDQAHCGRITSRCRYRGLATRAPKKPSNIDDAIDGIIDPTRGNTKEDEYEQWKREPIVGKGTDPIQYWFGLRDQYPNLSKMALTILSIPASSCECERVFSELGDLPEPRRRCISPELLAALHSVRRWRRAGFGGGDNDDMGQSKLTDEQMDVLYELSKWVGEDDDLDTWDDG